MLFNLAVVEELLRGYDVEVTGSSIAEKKRINQKTVANYLNMLEKKGIVKSRFLGRNKIFSLNLGNDEITMNFIMAAEHLKTIEFLDKQLVVKAICSRIKKHIKGTAAIFGSYAKGIQKKSSDLDIFVVGKADEDEIEKVAEMYNIKIDIKIYKTQINPDILVKEVIKDHVIIKNTEAFVSSVLNG